MSERQERLIEQLNADIERLQKERTAVGVAHMETTLKLREVTARLNYITAENKMLAARLAQKTSAAATRAKKKRTRR